MMRMDTKYMKMKKQRCILAFFSLFFLSSLLWAQGGINLGNPKGDGEEKEKPVLEKISLFLPQSQIRGGDSFFVILDVSINPKYHLYGYNAKKYDPDLIPVEGKISLPKGFQLVRTIYKEPEIKYDGNTQKKIPMYYKRVYVLFWVKAPKNLKKGKFTIKGSFYYQACTEENCFMPKKETFQVVLKAVSQETKVKVDQKILSRYPELQKILKKGVKKGPSSSSAPKTPKKDTPKKEKEPKVSKSQTGTSSSTLTGSVLTSQKEEGFEDKLKKGGLLAALLFAFLWGLGSALLPCVYPLIPLTIAYFANQSKGSTLKRISMASIYTFGIAMSFTVIAVVATYFFGKQAGSLLSNPWFVHGLTIFFVVLALSMFGLFEIRLPAAFTDKLQGSQKGGLLGAFMMGAVLGLVAAPCVAGPYATILAFSMKGGSLWIAGLANFAYGFGLGFPFLIMAIFSSSLTALPRAGEWMVRVKFIMGLVMIGCAIYFENLAELISWQWAGLGYGILLILASLFVGAFDPLSKDSSPLSRLFKGLGIVIFLLGISFFLGGLYSSGWILEKNPLPNPQVSKSQLSSISNQVPVREVQWVKDSKILKNPGLYAKERQKNLMIFFSATWCIYCKQMKKKVFTHPQIVELLNREFISMYADVDHTKGAMALKKKLALGALPGFAFYNKEGKLVGTMGKAGVKEFLAFLKKVVKSNQ